MRNKKVTYFLIPYFTFLISHLLCPVQIPYQLIESLKGVPGFDEQAFTAVHGSGEQVTSIRLNPRKISAEQLTANGYQLEQVPWCPHGYYLPQ